MKKLLIVFVLGLLIGSSVTHYYHKTKTIKEKGVLTERCERNQKLPNFTLDTLDGDVLSLDEFEDKKIVLNFFASWCPHCKEETPHLIQFKKAHEDVVVLMMNLTLLEDQFEDIETFQKVYDVNLPILIDEKGDLLRNFRIQGTPYNVFLDKEHVIKNIIPGGMNYEMLERQIESLD